MDSNSEGNADYQDAQFYDGLDGQMGGDLTGGADGELFPGDFEQMSPLREQDRFLPIANVSKIMKKPIPETGKIAKEAKECVQECVSEFISFITSEAAERCQQEKRKTINGEDILYAMSTLGFDTYVDPLKGFLTKYREAMKIDLAAMEGESVLDADYVHYGTVSGGAGSDAGSVAEPGTGNGGGLQAGSVPNQSQQAGQVGSTTVYYTTTPQVLTVNGSQLTTIGQIPNNTL